jgi:DNA-binding protein
MSEESTIMVGDKSIGTYYEAVMEQSEEHDSAKLLSRGQENNGKLLDVAEILRREEGTENAIVTRTASFENSDGEEVNVTELEASVNF